MPGASKASERHILVLNAGSSSLKAAVLLSSAGSHAPAAILRSEVSGLKAAPQVRVKGADGTTINAGPAAGVTAGSYEQALGLLLDIFAAAGCAPDVYAAAGHRVVHGGTLYRAPVRIDAAVVDALDGLQPLAPHHLPPNLAGIRALSQRLPHLPQVACFDTAFHATQGSESTTLPLPRDYRDKGYRRYGFHGLSYAFIVSEFRRVTGMPLPRRTIIAHLGNGASMCAVLRGHSVATTMGFSTLDGLMMGSRSGSIDPGVLIDLVRREGLGAEGLEDILYNRSGLLGLSGLSSDVRTLLAADTPEVRFAIDAYCAAAARHAASLMVPLGGCDALVFTGGVGENAAPIRRGIVERLAWAGLRLDGRANAGNQTRISTSASKLSAWVVPTDEENMIARETLHLVKE